GRGGSSRRTPWPHSSVGGRAGRHPSQRRGAEGGRGWWIFILIERARSVSDQDDLITEAELLDSGYTEADLRRLPPPHHDDGGQRYGLADELGWLDVLPHGGDE